MGSPFEQPQLATNSAPRPGARRFALLLTDVQGLETTLELQPAHPLTFGSAADADIGSGDALLELDHARLTWRDGRPQLRGIEGYFAINGARTGPMVVPLAHGDRVVLGGVVFSVLETIGEGARENHPAQVAATETPAGCEPIPSGTWEGSLALQLRAFRRQLHGRGEGVAGPFNLTGTWWREPTGRIWQATLLLDGVASAPLRGEGAWDGEVLAGRWSTGGRFELRPTFLQEASPESTATLEVKRAGTIEEPFGFPVPAGDFTVGKARGNQLVLPRSNLSARHGCFSRVTGRFTVESIGGEVQVNGLDVGPALVFLKPGDRVTMGDHEFALLAR